MGFLWKANKVSEWKKEKCNQCHQQTVRCRQIDSVSWDERGILKASGRFKWSDENVILTNIKYCRQMVFALFVNNKPPSLVGRQLSNHNINQNIFFLVVCLDMPDTYPMNIPNLESKAISMRFFCLLWKWYFPMKSIFDYKNQWNSNERKK